MSSPGVAGSQGERDRETEEGSEGERREKKNRTEGAEIERIWQGECVQRKNR